MSLSPSGLALSVAPPEVLKAVNAGTFNQCLTWAENMAIPNAKYNPDKNKSEG